MSRMSEERIVGDNIRGEAKTHIMYRLVSYLRTLAFTLVETRLEGFDPGSNVVWHIL